MIEILLVGEVGNPNDGMTASEFARQLRAAKGEAVTIRIASPGGDLFQGLAMYDYLRSLPETTVVIDGVAASIATIVALGARRVVMPANAMLMVHAPRAEKDGVAEELRSTADLLDGMAARLAAIIAMETGAPLEQAKAWLEAETWFSAEEALAAGFIDEVGAATPVRNQINLCRLGNVPDRVSRVLTESARIPTIPMTKLLTALNDLRLVNCGCGGGAAAPNEDDVVSQLKASIAALAAERDTIKAKLEATETELQGLKGQSATTLQNRAAIAVDTAIADGRLAPALKDSMVAAYVANELPTVKALADLPRTSAGTAPVARGSSTDDANTLRARIDSEPDARKRLAMRIGNWDALVAAG